MMKRFISLTLLLAQCLTAYPQRDPSPQSSPLLEACNAIPDAGKRLLCFQELLTLQEKSTKTEDKDNSNSIRELNRVFSSINGSVSNGVSFSQYQTLMLEPAKAVSIFKSENQNIDKKILDYLDQSAKAYADANVIWRADIYDSRDAGPFGKILSYRSSSQLMDIINRYELQTETVLSSDHLPSSQALTRIWNYANNSANLAFEILRKSGKNTIGLTSIDEKLVSNEVNAVFNLTGLILETSNRGLRVIKYSSVGDKESKIREGAIIFRVGKLYVTGIKQFYDAILSEKNNTKNNVPIWFEYDGLKILNIINLNNPPINN